MKHQETTETTISSYDRIALQYADSFAEDDSDLPYVNEFLRLLPPGGAILDAGCGPGNFCRYFAEKGYDVTGVDLSAGMLEVAAKLAPGVQLIQADLRSLSFPAGSLNGIFAAYSLIHIPTKDIEGVLKRFRSLLQPEGIVFAALQEGTNKDVIDESFGASSPLVHNCYTLDEASDLLEKAGFAIIKSFQRAPNPNEIPHDKLFILAKKTVV